MDHPDAARLIGEVQQEYVRRYGGVDEAALSTAEFASPHGEFLIGYLGLRAVACGGWRKVDPGDPDLRAGDAELKRMYVAVDQRGNGLSRKMLAALEDSAATAGHVRLVLSTGSAQPEAIGLYRASGYTAIAPFGHYRHEPDCRCFAKNLR